MKSSFSLFFYALISFSLFAQTTKELTDRLNFVKGELNKIEVRIKDGQDPALFKKFVDDFKAEKIELEKKLGAPSRPQISSEPQKKQSKKSVSSRKSSRLKTTVTLREKRGSKKRLTEVLSLLEKEQARRLDFLRRGIAGRQLRQVDVNISYLELEKIASQKSGGGQLSGNKSQFKYRGHMQFRTESAANQKGVQDTRQAEQSYLRLRTYLTFSPNNKLDFNLTPQATKGFGQDNSSGSATSGSTTHTELFFYEANIDYNIWDSLFLKLGRQELSYGDHLIIGALPWANTARSFDGLKLKYKYDWGWTDFFYSKITDNDNTAISGDDTDLFIVYNSWGYKKVLKNIDLYYIAQNNGLAGQVEINTLGFRLKGSHGPVFYRTENSTQNGANLGDDAYQYNLEVGGKYKSLSASAEYAVAGADYRQLYPTAHKFLGFADVLGRRNIEQLAFHLKGSPTKWLTVRADYHSFTRNKTDKSAYKLNGSSTWGTTGTSDDIGDEFDLVFIFKTKDSLKFQLGGAFFSPGQYLKDQDAAGRDETVRFIYGQVNATF